MTLGNILGTETGLTVLTTLLGGIWTAFKGTELYRQLSKQRYARAVAALEAGVELTYRTYVQSIKQAREDGKLTPEEMLEARRRARNAAIEYGKTQGIDVIRELGSDYIDLLIAKLVKGLKNS